MSRHRRKKHSADSYIYNAILLTIVLAAFLHFLYTLPGAEPEKPYYQVLFAEEEWMNPEYAD